MITILMRNCKLNLKIGFYLWQGRVFLQLPEVPPILNFNIKTPAVFPPTFLGLFFKRNLQAKRR